MKIALITDTHWGVRNDNKAFLDNNKKFLDNIFFPKLASDGVGYVIHLGDLVDRRKYININTATRLRQDFLEPLDQKRIMVDIIAGNHDTYYKNTNEVNALREIARSYPNLTVHDEHPVDSKYDNLNILLLPWICDENKKESYDAIKNSRSQVVMGHLELQGFEMFRGSVVSHGDDPRVFDRFDLVCSGHYHHRSNSGNINYLGSHGEFTWSDYDDPRGFHIFDTETRQLTFIQNTFTMFDKVWYNDQDKLMHEIMDHDFSKYNGKIIKVIVTNKTNPYWFDNFIEAIEKSGVIEMQVVEDHLNLNLEEDNNIVNEAESTIDIFKKFIEQVPAQNLDKKRLERTIVELYNEALTIE